MSLSTVGSERNRLFPSLPNHCSEYYEISGKYAVRKVVLPDGHEVTTQIVIDSNVFESEDAQSVFDHSLLRLKARPKVDCSETVPSADLFCGCGCLSLGAFEACRAIGKKFIPIVAMDKDHDALSVYEQNFNPVKTYPTDITTVIDGAIGSDPTVNELQMMKDCFSNIGSLSLLLAGPPCQGYSSLNYHTRQNDHRNIFYDTLYERVARFVELGCPENVMIENVPTVVHSKDKIVEKSIQLMENRGYFVDSGIVNLVDLGVPQLRKRHVIVASKRKRVSIEDTIEKYRIRKQRTFAWAAGDLQDETPTNRMTIPTRHSEKNKERIEYLHLNHIYDLPNEMRPRCHQKKHGYKSMYGRIRMEEPSQTVTSGFPSPGQGRFIHPTKMRTITPHEAARLQLVPDFFDFSNANTRRSLSLMIGNAAPMKLSYAFCLELLT